MTVVIQLSKVTNLKAEDINYRYKLEIKYLGNGGN